MILIFWIPLLSGAALTIFGLAVPSLGISIDKTWAYAALAVGLVLLALAWYLAKRHGQAAGQGGRGGDAVAQGDDSEAEGGAGGVGNRGVGGAGGHAVATGKGARAKGGAGGRA